MAKIGSFRCGDGVRCGAGWHLDLTGHLLHRLITGRSATGGALKVSTRLELLDKHEAVRSVDINSAFVSGNVSFDASHDLARSGHLQILDISGVDYFADRVRIYYRVQLDDGTFYEIPLGIFLMTLPDESIGATETVLDLDLFDKATVLQDYTFLDTRISKAGRNIFEEIRHLCLDPEGAQSTQEPDAGDDTLVSSFDFPRIPRATTPSAFYCGATYPGTTKLNLTWPDTKDTPMVGGPLPLGDPDVRFRVGSFPWRRAVKYVRVFREDPDDGLTHCWSNGPVQEPSGSTTERNAALVYVDDWHADLYLDRGPFTLDELASWTWSVELTYTDDSVEILGTEALWLVFPGEVVGPPLYGFVYTNATDVTWDAGTPVLHAINDLLRGSAFEKAYFDRLGRLCVKPLDANPSVLLPAVTYATDGHSIILDPVSRRFDTGQIANKVIVIGEKIDDVTIKSDPMVNDSPYSPVSTVNRGRTITKVVKEDKITTKEAADVIALDELYKASMVTEEISLPTVPDPRRDCYEVYFVAIRQNEDDVVLNRYLVKSWSLPLGLDQMVHQISKVTSLI